MFETETKSYKIGFLGAYAYDIILYLARSLSLGGKQVLVIDRSTDQEVVRTVRSVKEGELSLGVFRFCGIDITARVLLPEQMNPEVAYDVVIYDFGENMCPEEYHSCNVMCYVLDMYAHNALCVRNADATKESVITWMIQRDLFRGKAMARYHIRQSEKKVEKENVFYTRLNVDDFISRFRMEIDQIPRMELASEEMQELIRQLCARLYPELLLKKKGRLRDSIRDSA